MEEDTKKISFSFKQVLSKPKVVPVASKSVLEKTVQFIECVEEKSIKVLGPEVENNDHELIIPMQPYVKQKLTSESVKQKPNGTENKSQENGVKTLDDMAVQAILSDCHKTKGDEDEDTKTIEVPLIRNPPEGKEVSTPEDYENIPISKFGLAMIRGMGWEASKGVGKNPQIISASSISNIRPKGMGLGADKLLKSVQMKQNVEEELKLKDGSYVQFLLGRLDGQYGQVKGFDEGAARVVVKIARTGQMEKVSENTFRLVSKNDFDKNSKVINIRENKEYHEGKLKLDDSEDRIYRHENKNKLDSQSNHHSRHKTKKSKHSKSPHKKHKSDHNRHKKYKRKRSSS